MRRVLAAVLCGALVAVSIPPEAYAQTGRAGFSGELPAPEGSPPPLPFPPEDGIADISAMPSEASMSPLPALTSIASFPGRSIQHKKILVVDTGYDPKTAQFSSYNWSESDAEHYKDTFDQLFDSAAEARDYPDFVPAEPDGTGEEAVVAGPEAVWSALDAWATRLGFGEPSGRAPELREETFRLLRSEPELSFERAAARALASRRPGTDLVGLESAVSLGGAARAALPGSLGPVGAVVSSGRLYIGNRAAAYVETAEGWKKVPNAESVWDPAGQTTRATVQEAFYIPAHKPGVYVVSESGGLFERGERRWKQVNEGGRQVPRFLEFNGIQLPSGISWLPPGYGSAEEAESAGYVLVHPTGHEPHLSAGRAMYAVPLPMSALWSWTPLPEGWLEAALADLAKDGPPRAKVTVSIRAEGPSIVNGRGLGIFSGLDRLGLGFGGPGRLAGWALFLGLIAPASAGLGVAVAVYASAFGAVVATILGFMLPALAFFSAVDALDTPLGIRDKAAAIAYLVAGMAPFAFVAVGAPSTAVVTALGIGFGVAGLYWGRTLQHDLGLSGDPLRQAWAAGPLPSAFGLESRQARQWLRELADDPASASSALFSISAHPRASLFVPMAARLAEFHPDRGVQEAAVRLMGPLAATDDAARKSLERIAAEGPIALAALAKGFLDPKAPAPAEPEAPAAPPPEPVEPRETGPREPPVTASGADLLGRGGRAIFSGLVEAARRLRLGPADAEAGR